MGTPTLKKTTEYAKVLTFIKKAMILKYGTMSEYARKRDVSLQYISNVMAGNKPIPDWMYKSFGVKHIVTEHWEVKVGA